jgi:hypothetical protein
MKKFAIILAVLVLSGCKNSYSDANFPVRPPELEDCKFFHLSNSDASHITVVRCPNSTTSTTSGGKHKRTAVVIDGVEYHAPESNTTIEVENKKSTVVIDGVEYVAKDQVQQNDNAKPQGSIPK